MNVEYAMIISILNFAIVVVNMYLLLLFVFVGAARSQICSKTSNVCLDPVRVALLAIAKNCTNDNGILTEYWVYNTPSGVKLNSANEVDITKPIKFLLHGWGGSKDVDYIQVIRSAYLQRYQSQYTIITLDFGVYVPGEAILTFANAYCNAPAVAISFGRFLCNLIGNGVNPNSIHVVGHSLGAQIAGMAGSYVQSNCNRKIGRITGLDPASVGYICMNPNECRLDELDAEFVDVIHTNMFGYGTPLPSGHIDFYVNSGGPAQPNCIDLALNFSQLAVNPLSVVLSPVSCSHQRSCFLFAESILLNSFPGNCSPLPTEVIYMGEYCKPQQTYKACTVPTRGTSPYGYGPNGALE